jgi:hypothetical protein
VLLLSYSWNECCGDVVKFWVHMRDVRGKKLARSKLLWVVLWETTAIRF